MKWTISRLEVSASIEWWRDGSILAGGRLSYQALKQRREVKWVSVYVPNNQIACQ